MFKMALFIYILLGVCIISYELFRKKYTYFDGVSFANLNYFIFYVLTPALLIVYPEWSQKLRLLDSYHLDTENLAAAIAILVCYCAMLTGWWFAGKIRIKYFDFKLSHCGELRFVYLGLFLGFSAFVAYVAAFGGLQNALTLGSAIRYGTINHEDVGVGTTEVFKHFIFALQVSFVYLYAAIFLEKSKSKLLKLSFVFSGLILALYFLIISSRAESSRRR